MSNKTATCAITNSSKDILMHPIRNKGGNMIGFLFINEAISKDVDKWEIDVTIGYKNPKNPKEIADKVIRYQKNRIDNL